LRQAEAEKNLAVFKQRKSELLTLIAELDALTGTRPEWLMGGWVSDARRWGHTPEETAYMDKIARMILTTWVENPQTDLTDYANREWNGLLGQYYLPRWRMFLDAMETSLASGKPLDMGAFNNQRGQFEVKWIGSRSTNMTARPVGDTISISRNLFEKYHGI
jgi:alpha-N-acetylglucosaminidase